MFMASIDQVIKNLRKYVEPFSNEPLYLPYVINFIKKPVKYVEIPFSEQIEPLDLTFYLLKKGLDCIADRIIFPPVSEPLKITCSKLSFFLIILKKKSFIINEELEKTIENKINEIEKALTDNKLAIREISIEGISYFYNDNNSDFSIINFLSDLINLNWDIEQLVFNDFMFTVYRKDISGKHWIFVKREEIERYIERIMKG